MLAIKGSIEYISSCMYLLPMAIGTFNNMAINLALSIFFSTFVKCRCKPNGESLYKRV